MLNGGDYQDVLGEGIGPRDESPPELLAAIDEYDRNECIDWQRGNSENSL